MEIPLRLRAKTQMASLKDVSASVKWRKELNIDLDFDDLVVTQITCKTCNLFALPNMASNFKLGIALKEGVFFFSCKIVHAYDTKARIEPFDIGKGYRKWI